MVTLVPPRWRWPQLIPWHLGARRCYLCRWAIDAHTPKDMRKGEKSARYVEIADLPGYGGWTYNAAALCQDCWAGSTVDVRVCAHLWDLRYVTPAGLTYFAVKEAVLAASGRPRPA